MKTTDCRIYYNGKLTQADAIGNNVAWMCPGCSHPVLFVCLENQKGFDGKYTDCKGCGKAYTLLAESESTLVIKAAK